MTISAIAISVFSISVFSISVMAILASTILASTISANVRLTSVCIFNKIFIVPHSWIVYEWIWVYMCARLYACACVYTCVCMYVVHMCVCVCMYVRVYRCLHVCMCRWYVFSTPRSIEINMGPGSISSLQTHRVITWWSWDWLCVFICLPFND